MDGTRAGFGVNMFREKIATLEGRSAPQGTQHLPDKTALSVRERTISGKRAMSVTIYFDSVPTYEMHPLTAPQKGEWWFQSQGNCSVEHDAQLCNAYLIARMFPSADAKMRVSSEPNAVIRGMNGLTSYSFKVYSWETNERYIVQVLGNNTIAVTKRDRPRID
jgi:hypothetical protein